jgi:hypothetical protein
MNVLRISPSQSGMMRIVPSVQTSAKAATMPSASSTVGHPTMP